MYIIMPSCVRRHVLDVIMYHHVSYIKYKIDTLIVLSQSLKRIDRLMLSQGWTVYAIVCGCNDYIALVVLHWLHRLHITCRIGRIYPSCNNRATKGKAKKAGNINCEVWPILYLDQ